MSNNKWLVILGLCFLLIGGCSGLTDKRIFRLGMPKKMVTMAPYFYQPYLPQELSVNVMVLNNADQLRSALLVEAVDLAILPAQLVFEEQLSTNHLTIISSLHSNRPSSIDDQVILVLVCKQSLYQDHRESIQKILICHQQASAYLNGHRKEWIKMAVEKKLDLNSVKQQIDWLTLSSGIEQTWIEQLKARGKFLAEQGLLSKEPEYNMILNQSHPK